MTLASKSYYNIDIENDLSYFVYTYFNNHVFFKIKNIALDFIKLYSTDLTLHQISHRITIVFKFLNERKYVIQFNKHQINKTFKKIKDISDFNVFIEIKDFYPLRKKVFTFLSKNPSLTLEELYMKFHEAKKSTISCYRCEFYSLK